MTVKAVKAQLKSGDPKYKTLMNEYVDAYAKYDGWVGALKNAIVAGKTKNLSSDPEYTQIANDAAAASQKFVQDAIASTQGEHERCDCRAQLTRSIGVNVWNSYASGSQQRRMKYADYVANDFYDAVCSARPESRILFSRCELLPITVTAEVSWINNRAGFGTK